MCLITICLELEFLLIMFAYSDEFCKLPTVITLPVNAGWMTPVLHIHGWTHSRTQLELFPKTHFDWPELD